MNFDYPYWGIYPENLEKGEKVVQELALKYDLNFSDLCKIEERAKDEAIELICSSNSFDNLTNTINQCKIEAAIDIICQQNDELQREDFDTYVDGNIIEASYQNERIV